MLMLSVLHNVEKKSLGAQLAPNHLRCLEHLGSFGLGAPRRLPRSIFATMLLHPKSLFDLKGIYLFNWHDIHIFQTIDWFLFHLWSKKVIS